MTVTSPLDSEHHQPYQYGQSWFYLIPHWSRGDVSLRVGPFHSIEECQADIDVLQSFNGVH